MSEQMLGAVDPEADQLGDDPAGRFAGYAAATSAAWHEDGVLEGMTVVPAEMPAIAALGVNIIEEWNHKVVSDQVRSGEGFGEVLPAADQGGLTGMLAFVGREG